MPGPSIQTALEAADSALFLDTPAEIARACKAWRRSRVLALDTEFVRERTYYADLGLVQISDGSTVWLVDPLVKGSLDHIKALLEDRSVTKLVHSPSEDLEVLWKTVGALPEPMVDTQTACAFLGQPLQLAYHAAANWLLGVEVAKDQTRSNWLKRPLRPVQLRYAALDVCLLPEMWRMLGKQLSDTGRLAWLEEDCAMQLERARGTVPDDQAWLRIRGVNRLDGVGLAIIQQLAAWREREARQRNLPRGFVLPDAVLLRISQDRIAGESQLDGLEGLHPRARQKHGGQVTQLVRQALSSGDTLTEIKPLGPAERKKLNLLRDAVQKRATALGIDPALLASRRELEGLLRMSDWPDKFAGWRKQVIGEELERIL